MKMRVLPNGKVVEIPTNEVEGIEIALNLQELSNSVDENLDNFTEVLRHIRNIKQGLKENDLKKTLRGFYCLEFKITRYYGENYFKSKIVKYIGNGGGTYPLVRDMYSILRHEVKENIEYVQYKYGKY